MSTAPQPTALRLSASALDQFAGPWLMGEDRIKSLCARMRSMPAARVPCGDDDRDAGGESVAGYTVSGGVARIDVCGILTKYPLPYGMDEWCGTIPTIPLIAALNKAMADWTVNGVVWVIDSPGGMVAGTNMLAEAIAAANKVKPQYAVVSDLAASGGYYIASQCRSVACNAMGEVGCIGVYTVLADWSKFYADFGITLTVVSSGGVKGLGADGVVSQELIDDQKRGIVGMYEKFIADVAAGRGISIEQSRQLGDGRCWIAPEALKLGLIDSVAPVGEAVAAASMEVQLMNAEQFRAYAASNPTAAEVQALVTQGYTQAKAEFSPKAATVADLEAIAPGDSAFVLGQLKAGATVASATGAYAALMGAKVKALESDLATKDTAHKAELAAKDQVIAQKTFEATGQRPIGTAGASGGEPAKVADEPETNDPKVRADWAKAKAGEEWDKNPDARKGYSTKDRYVAVKSREILGLHKVLTK